MGTFNVIVVSTMCPGSEQSEEALYSAVTCCFAVGLSPFLIRFFSFELILLRDANQM